MPKLDPIIINLSALAEEFSLKEAQIEELGAVIVGAVTDRIYYNWHAAAMRGLKSSRNQYINNLQIGQISPTKKFIQLTGKLPNMIEDGVGAFDMKVGFLKGPKVKVGKNGIKYITIPFRHATPGAIGEDAAFSNVMPPQIYDIVKNLRPLKTNITIGNTQRPASLSNDSIPERFRVQNTRPAISNLNTQKTYSAYQHKSSIYTGMIREEKTYENATQGKYITFRRVSEKSDVNSWIHRGILAHNFAQKALADTDVGTITDRAIDAYLEQMNK